jgi:homoserine kinase
VAANQLLDQPLAMDDLYAYAVEGEFAASGSRHGDNVAPSLLGGLVLATDQFRVRLPVPSEWHVLLIHPDCVVETRVARARLQQPFTISEFVNQSACLAMFMSGLYRGDLPLVQAGLRDLLVEPRRADLIPGFHAVKHALLDHNAIGASISGAGPSVFGWFVSKEQAESAQVDALRAFAQHGLKARAWVSPIQAPGARLLDKEQSPWT